MTSRAQLFARSAQVQSPGLNDLVNIHDGVSALRINVHNGGVTVIILRKRPRWCCLVFVQTRKQMVTSTEAMISDHTMRFHYNEFTS